MRVFAPQNLSRASAGRRRWSQPPIGRYATFTWRSVQACGGRAALLLHLRAKLGDLALEDALADEVRLRVGREDFGQITAVRSEFTRVPVEREQHHSSVLGALSF